jgi:hypothetical protein
LFVTVEDDVFPSARLHCVLIVATDQAIDTTTPVGRLLLHMPAAIAEFERDLIRERGMAGTGVPTPRAGTSADRGSTVSTSPQPRRS